MHEASLMADLMRRIEQVAQAERAERVVGVSVWLGALSHMSEEHFREHFDRSSAGTRAEGARLDVTVSENPEHENAQHLVLERVEVET